MTLSEFSIEFDVLYNNISSNQAPGLTEYEKSIFLTQAQESLVVELYKGSLGDSFENTEEVTRYLSSLVKTISQSTDYTIPEDCLFIVSVTDIKNNIVIAPTTHDRAIKEKKNPFKNNTERLLYLSEGDKIILFGELPNPTINISYLSKPTPIILESLNDFTINGKREESNTNLPESLHRTILLKAVQLAKAIWA